MSNTIRSLYVLIIALGVSQLACQRSPETETPAQSTQQAATEPAGADDSSAAAQLCPDPTCVISTTAAEPNNVAPIPPPEGVEKVAMIMFFEESCDGTPAMHHEYDLRQDCFGWVRTVDANTAIDYDPSETTRDNSAACFICYQGALCFREYTGVLSCENADTNGVIASWSTDKLLSTEECVLDGGNAYTLLQGGSENCPPLPEGYDLQACHDELVQKCGHAAMPIHCVGCCAKSDGCTNS